jgi:hypothetical protein
MTLRLSRIAHTSRAYIPRKKNSHAGVNRLARREKIRRIALSDLQSLSAGNRSLRSGTSLALQTKAAILDCLSTSAVNQTDYLKNPAVWIGEVYIKLVRPKNAASSAACVVCRPIQPRSDCDDNGFAYPKFPRCEHFFRHACDLGSCPKALAVRD